MIIEAIVESVIPFLGRLLGWIFIEFLWQVVCYSLGYGFLKLVTLGRYPKPSDSTTAIVDQAFYVMFTGGVVLFILIGFLVWLI